MSPVKSFLLGFWRAFAVFSTFLIAVPAAFFAWLGFCGMLIDGSANENHNIGTMFLLVACTALLPLVGWFVFLLRHRVN